MSNVDQANQSVLWESVYSSMGRCQQGVDVVTKKMPGVPLNVIIQQEGDKYRLRVYENTPFKSTNKHNVATTTIKTVDRDAYGGLPMLNTESGKMKLKNDILNGTYDLETIHNLLLKSLETIQVLTNAKPMKPVIEYDEGKPISKGVGGEIMKMAMRPQGVTVAELVELTGWKRAPWKYLISNQKGTGYADKSGYELIASKNGREAIYKVRKRQYANV